MSGFWCMDSFVRAQRDISAQGKSELRRPRWALTGRGALGLDLFDCAVGVRLVACCCLRLLPDHWLRAPPIRSRIFQKCCKICLQRAFEVASASAPAPVSNSLPTYVPNAFAHAFPDVVFSIVF